MAAISYYGSATGTAVECTMLLAGVKFLEADITLHCINCVRRQLAAAHTACVPLSDSTN